MKFNIILCVGILSAMHAYADTTNISTVKQKIKPIMSNEQVGDQDEGDKAEQRVIHKVIKVFADKAGCIIPANSNLEKWGAESNKVKYSIKWQQQCGPVIDGVYQLGDNGWGSTFVCERSADSVCCWPLGYDYVKEYVICTELNT